MVTRAQVDRLAQRLEALGSGRSKRIVVQGPEETTEEALERDGLLGLVAVRDCIFIRTGVPRSH